LLSLTEKLEIAVSIFVYANRGHWPW